MIALTYSVRCGWRIIFKRIVPRGAEISHHRFYDSDCHTRGTNRVPRKYKSDVLPLELICVVIVGLYLTHSELEALRYRTKIFVGENIKRNLR